MIDKDNKDLLETLPPLMPYVFRAFYEWMLDAELTPFIIVDTTDKEVSVPKAEINDDRIILNIAEEAVRELEIDNCAIEFDACFGGVVHHIFIPVHSIMVIYAKENGAGTIFPPEERQHQKEIYFGCIKSGTPNLKIMSTDKELPPVNPKKTKSVKLNIIDGDIKS
jgi:stringent starvation protein B